jgi:hypothetical protein
MRKDILENANTYTLSDFQKLKLAESYKKLYSDTILENKKREKQQYDKRIYNLSLKDLFENFFTVWTHIINDMTTLMYDNDNENNRSWNNYISILMKHDRIIYVGIMFVLIGLILYFIFLTR